MLARGRTLSYAVIAERLGYEGSDPRNLVSVLAYRAKRLLAARGHGFPIERVHGLGLRWCQDGEGKRRPSSGKSALIQDHRIAALHLG